MMLKSFVMLAVAAVSACERAASSSAATSGCLETAKVEFGVIPFMAEIGTDDAAFAKAAPVGFPQTCSALDGYGVASTPPEYICSFTGSDGVEYGVFQGAAAEKDASLSTTSPGPLGLRRGDTMREAEEKLRQAGAKPSRHTEDDGTVSLLASLCDANGVAEMADFEVKFDGLGGARAIRLRATVV